MHLLEAKDFPALFTVLQEGGFFIVGPTVRDGAIVLDSITSADELPVGWTDVQDAGAYSIVRRDDRAYFGYAVGPHSWKRYLYPPRVRLFSATRSAKSFDVVSAPEEHGVRYAFLGVRPCELSALTIHDRVFATGKYTDPVYTRRRNAACVIAVNCTNPAGTCFCVSMGTGLRAGEGYDLLLTEVQDGSDHFFLVNTGTELGKRLLDGLPGREAAAAETTRGDRLLEKAVQHMGRSLNTEGLRQALTDGFESPCWDNVAKRCLACANCTLVCPTCFCSTVEDTTDLAGDNAERWRRWDSCFTSDFTRVAGGNIRMSTRTRYRQWLTHKLANWVDQFGTMGCVGCGRCITWCPAGIDITREAVAVRSGAALSTTAQEPTHA